jgi:hypothetical protein
LVAAYFSFLFSDIILNKLASVLSISEPLSKNLKQTQRGLLYIAKLFFSRCNESHRFSIGHHRGENTIFYLIVMN